jgi:5-formyltetrahydrofolate cyclo-ligase
MREALGLDIKARKSAIRREIVGRIGAMDPEARRFQESALVGRLESLPGFEPARSVLLYASAFPEEFDTGPMLRRVVSMGKRLLLPTVDRAARRLRLFEVADIGHDLIPGLRGIPEPRPDCREAGPGEVDWVLVPGLGFDRRGHRLGRGAGHYDRLLPTLRPDVPRWALILDPQWVEDLPVEPHDQPIDGVADYRSMFFREPARLNRGSSPSEGPRIPETPRQWGS